MSGTATFVSIIVMRIVMQKRAESIQRKSDPFGVANAEYVQRAVRAHVAVAHRRKSVPRQSVRLSHAK